MADVFTPEERSRVMSLIRSKNTKAERIAFAYLRKSKVYFQVHYARAAGKPDIALPRKKRAVFIDGDFWHGKTNTKVIQNRPPDDYWVNKIKRNMERDRENEKQLSSGGWQVLRIWEKDILRKSSRVEVLESIYKFLRSYVLKGGSGSITSRQAKLQLSKTEKTSLSIGA